MMYLKQYIRTFAIFTLLLLAGSITNHVWAATVTYHILTLPIDNSIYHMKTAVSGKRLEAVKIVVNDQTVVGLPAHYKSPLAENFTYYKAEDITIGGSAISLYDGVSNCKGILYEVNASPTPIAEGSAPYANTAEYYVVYTYKTDNTIAKLDGSVNYNISVKNLGFLSLNRGRNNRPAVVLKDKVDPEMLASPDFSNIGSPGNSINSYWADGNNKNSRDSTESKFFFGFKFEGKDPYHIIVKTSYKRNYTYIEKNEGTSNFVYKWYKEAALMAAGTGNAYLASDDHVQYTTPWVDGDPNTQSPASSAMTGYFHGNKCTWSTVALLNNTSKDGYVFMGTRTVDGNGAVPTPSNNKYYYLKFTGNNLNYGLTTAADATNNHMIDGIYPIEKVTFKVVTPFYDPEDPSDDHIISVLDQVSKYTVENDPIETKYLPAALKRKYCNFNGNFYKDAACTQAITHFSQATWDPTEGYQVYVGYDVSASVPFKAITPAAAYDATTWAGATWYELTDAASSQIDGIKLKYDGENFKNDGADGEYAKTSEFAFIGDPYELQVVYRNTTSGASPKFVGATGTPTSPTNLTISETATAGYIWELPNDATAGSFLLQKYKGEGNWYWEVTRPAPVAISYSTKAHTYNVATANAQAVTFNVSNLTDTEDYYITVTAGGTNSDQVTLPTGKIYVESGGTASFTVAIKARGGSDKQFTLSIQEYKANGDAVEAASVITVNQKSDAISSNAVQYSTTSSTRVKVMELPQKTYTYKIVDRSGRIAVTASASQTIFSPLSLTSIPSIIVSPFILDETITFYSSFDNGTGAGTGTSRTHLSTVITETPSANAPIYVKYTTTNLNSKPFKLSEDQEIFVRLNEQYIYYDAGTIKSTASSSDSDDNYKWKLRNRDPYAMLIDNMGARKVLPDPEHNIANDSESITVPSNDNGGTTTESRQKGAWVDVETIENAGTLTFTTVRANAQQFIAKSSAKTGVYEVMVATGDGVDASTTYYNIGRPDENTIKIYNNETYQASYDDEIKFRLEEKSNYVYHLIDKAKHELLSVESKSPELVLPAEYQSPLVGTANYSYYSLDQLTIDTSKNPNEYTPTNPAVKLTAITDLDAQFPGGVEASSSSEYSEAAGDNKHEIGNEADIQSEAKKLTTTGYHYYNINNGVSYKKVNITRAYRGTDIYVTYVKNDLIGFNNTGKVNDHPYLLKFLNPLAEGYFLEDGKDGLMTEKLKAIYPYCNGDGNLNIYGETMRDEQMNGGSSTRPRWVWFFESAANDPYHVRIHSRSTIAYSGVNYPTYLQTYAVHFNQDTGANAKKQRVVTGGALPGVASDTPTEYMVLGIAGAYKLLTTQKIGADEDGNGTITDGETKRREVRSLEQYWKTYNMVKLEVLGVSASTDAYSDDETTWVVPKTDDPETGSVDESTYRATLAARDWHSYDAYANATRWNGYNDKSDGHEKKVVEKIEHWYQTFDMGNGTFDIETADIPPVLVLLDRHGWEIMRKPLPVANYPLGDDELAALRVYDSPMVDRYYFYSNATKASGCHKYTLRMQDGKERDQIKVDGVHYSSTSLGDLPPASATGVKSSGVLNDQFVIYTVKEEYEKCYAYNFVDNGDGTYAESGTASKFLMLQNSRFARDNEGTGDRINYLSKPIEEASDPVGGNVYDMIISPNQVTVSNVSTNVDENKDGKVDDKNLWYIKPNLNIDKEMGIKWALAAGGTGEPLTEYETKKAYKDKTGFDPYNIQLQNVGNSKYLTTHMTSTKLENGIMVGDYSGAGDSEIVTFGDWVNVKDADTSTPKKINDVIVNEGYDHTYIQLTNQTFMAVSDANGNMQLMPRFDHTKRINVTTGQNSKTTLQAPVDHAKASAEVNSSMGPQTTFFVRSQRFHYHIIDNDGLEALRYKRSGDFYPTITDHFKSPLATDFKYYKDLTLTDGVYTEISTKADISSKEITSSLAASGYTDDDCHVYVRYSYDESADRDADQILQGQWFTVKLANKDLQSSGEVVTTEGETQGTGVNLYAGEEARSLTATAAEYETKKNALSQTGDYYFRIGTSDYTYKKVSVTTVPIDDASDYTETTDDGTLGYDIKWANSKPLVVDSDYPKWQWKFLAAPSEPTSSDGTPNPYYVAPDPYSVKIFNRKANYSDGLSEPNPMGIPIKVPNESTGANRFALLSHPNSGYALAVAKTYADYSYQFLNGASMDTNDAATTATEASFNYKNGIISNGSQVLLNNDVTYRFTYNVITNASKLATSAEQNNEEATSHGYIPYLPESIQSPLLDMDDYKYYGTATISSGNYTVVDGTKLITLYGLYNDEVYVRYKAYDTDSTSFKIPNKRNDTGTGQVARDAGSNDVSMNINGELPYNIIWYGDNMMSTASEGSTTITDGGSHALDGDKKYVWYFEGNDPYTLKIRHKESSNYVDGSATLVADAANAMKFMLLKKTNYDYGILQEMGGNRKFTFGDHDDNVETDKTFYLTDGDPEKFIIFGLSVHDLIYRLIIAKTCTKEEETDPHLDPSKYVDIPYRVGNESTYQESGTWTISDVKRIYGSTQRDLTAGTPAGATYQLGETISWGGVDHTYSYDAGTVSIGDVLEVPNIFYRPNCTFDFYIQDIYRSDKTTAENTLNNKYKGLKLKNLMSDADLIDKTVVVNVVYSFNSGLDTNAGLDFVTSVGQNLWYTFETSNATPQLAHYTFVRGMRAEEGRALHYTNDYLWTPLGDPYGFRSYNRYIYKNNGATTSVLTTDNIADGQEIKMGAQASNANRDIYELLPSGDIGTGSFRVHPLLNTDNTLFLSVVESGDPGDIGKLILSDGSPVPIKEWTYGLSQELLNPYYQGAGNVGGLNDAGKTAYETAQTTYAANPAQMVREFQKICYDDANIVQYSPGYYRLCNQPGASSLSPQRYASGYLHDIEKTAGTSSTGIPMHFYSRKGVTGSFNGDINPLGASGYTSTAATRGEIPVPATEYDASTIFQFTGTKDAATMQTQGLYVQGNQTSVNSGYARMTADSEDATSFKVADIGGAVVIIYNDGDSRRHYLNYAQNKNDSIYELQYYENVPVDGSKWCMVPADTMAIATNNGGDGYYYCTFYAPFDVSLPADAGGETYNAYICKKWHDEGLHPTAVPATTVNAVNYAEGKFVPAGTPVIIRTSDESNSVTLTLPTTLPTASSITTDLKGEYLEQMLSADASHDAYTFGLYLTSDGAITIDRETGIVTASLVESATSGVGFYINATPNKENNALRAMWQRNNRYVLHNKVYYREESAPSREASRGIIEFVPVLFDDEENDHEGEGDSQDSNVNIIGNGCIYDLQGRMVATRQQVEDGSWNERLTPGVYIRNGKKFLKK